MDSAVYDVKLAHRALETGLLLCNKAGYFCSCLQLIARHLASFVAFESVLQSCKAWLFHVISTYKA